MEIKKAAVLGSGVMGSAIAAHFANAGIPVLLLDIVPEGATNKNVLAEKAIERMLAASPAPFIHKNRAKLVTPGNLEELDVLGDVDWIVEAVLEKLEVKQDVYKRIDAVRKKGSVVSSNTSTLPLKVLEGIMSDDFKRDFMITHFFNPPRYMRLLEVVGSSVLRKDAYDAICDFADKKLGKGVVECKDTPGFIANRIGIYWLTLGLVKAIEMKVPVEVADAVMGKPGGIPKTGVFGLFDLIGIDLMPLIAKSMLATLPKEDAFRTTYKELDLVKKMISEGYTGRKGKGGFYRINKEGGKKLKEVIDLQTGEYKPEKKPELESVAAAKLGLRALVGHPDIGGQYARAVLLGTLHYAASLLPEIADDIVRVDEALRMGFNWKYGPFELIDRIGNDAFTATLQKEGMSIPPILAKAAGRPLYRTEGGKRQYMMLSGDYGDIALKEGCWTLADIKLKSKPITKNGSASLWDVGDGIACLEFTSKMNSIDPDILTMIEQSIGIVKEKYKGMIIGSDADNFSVGANLGFILYAANMAAYPLISDVIKQGQRAMIAMKYAPFPVVAALGGMALGGGCETVLHCDAVQAHVESYPGLVEVGVGLIPGWGGCKELLLRNAGGPAAQMPAIAKVFETIGLAKVGTSAEEARDMKILNDKSRVTMNRVRLLNDAKQLCLQLAEGYTPPEPATLQLPGPTGKTALFMALDGLAASGKATSHDVTVCRALAKVLTGGDTDMLDALTEQQILDLEVEEFMKLIRTRPTLDRVEYMLANNKPLRN